MTRLTIDIPDAQTARVINAVCKDSGYDPASGLSKAEYAKLAVISWLKSCVKRVEGEPIDTEARSKRAAVAAEIDALDMKFTT